MLRQGSGVLASCEDVARQLTVQGVDLSIAMENMPRSVSRSRLLRLFSATNQVCSSPSGFYSSRDWRTDVTVACQG